LNLVRDLAGIISPLDPSSFLADDYGRRFRHIAGTRGKFAELLPWPVLNRILEEHRLEPPRLRLTREGKPIPPERYLSYSANRRRSGQPIPRLNSASLTRELRDGATLVLDAADELHRPIRQIAEALERVFRVRIQVNAYAGWRTSHGFDLHWDDHDVFVLQVAGRKHWKVYGMTRRYPLGRDAEPAGEPPSQPLWEGLLEDGDTLYIPRGWWHVAQPLDEPTLHLTVGVNNLTGADLLSWFADRMRGCETVRRDIPHWNGPDACRAFAEELHAALLREWHPDLVADFLAEKDAGDRPRPRFALPSSAMPDVLPEGDFVARWRGARALPVHADGDQVSIAANGRRWRFARASRPVLEQLLNGDAHSTEDLARELGLDAQTIRAFLRELAAEGLIVTDPQ
jgi:ribosomal protein L16 Arg81 hydroxylase